LRTSTFDTTLTPGPRPFEPARTRTGVLPFLAFLGLLLVFRSVILDWNRVPTASMVPTIQVGDHIIVDKLAYDLRIPFTNHALWQLQDPAKGDIVAFRSPADDSLYVKRVIGTPGDTVALVNDVLVVNGQPASLSPTHADSPALAVEERLWGHSHLISLAGNGASINSFGPIVVPPGAYLMLGDNRHVSFDSRQFGFVDRSRILGRATTVAFSLDYDRAYRPRPERLFAALL
jgi:signal peptidase I